MYNYTDVYGVAQTDIAIGPYSATLNGGGYNNTAVYLFCYDFNSPTYIGTAYNGTMDVVTDFTGPTRTAMMEASYLIYELAAAGMNNAPLSVKGAISLAIWEIMNPSSNTALSQFPTDPAALPYEAAAATVVANGTWTIADAMLYPVWVPDNPSIQRFGIVVAGSPPVPPNTPGAVVNCTFAVTESGLSSSELTVTRKPPSISEGVIATVLLTVPGVPAAISVKSP